MIWYAQASPTILSTKHSPGIFLQELIAMTSAVLDPEQTALRNSSLPRQPVATIDPEGISLIIVGATVAAVYTVTGSDALGVPA